MIFGGVTSFLYFTTLLQHYDRNVKYALQSIMETQFKMIKPKGERNILKNQKKSKSVSPKSAAQAVCGHRKSKGEAETRNLTMVDTSAGYDMEKVKTQSFFRPDKPIPELVP